jgi:hypothetical protein
MWGSTVIVGKGRSFVRDGIADRGLHSDTAEPDDFAQRRPV